jgi:hypothetical protein
MKKANIHSTDPFVDNIEDDSLLLNLSSKAENLSSLHFPYHIVQKMWEVYIERVDPMMKLLHLPTFWPTLTNAIQNPRSISQSLEALVFVFYLVTISSMEESEVQSVLGEQKLTIFPRYRLAARQALINAEFLKTSNLVTLQAYVIFLVCSFMHFEIWLLLTDIDGNERLLA